jgi:hypothetical protein
MLLQLLTVMQRVAQLQSMIALRAERLRVVASALVARSTLRHWREAQPSTVPVGLSAFAETP